MTHPVFSMFPFFLFLPQQKPEEREENTPLRREKLLSSRERLRVPTPAERLLQD